MTSCASRKVGLGAAAVELFKDRPKLSVLSKSPQIGLGRKCEVVFLAVDKALVKGAQRCFPKTLAVHSLKNLS